MVLPVETFEPGKVHARAGDLQARLKEFKIPTTAAPPFAGHRYSTKLTEVETFVIAQMPALSETFPTVLTCIRSIFRMASYVRNQMTRLSEAFMTNLTLIWSFSWKQNRASEAFTDSTRSTTPSTDALLPKPTELRPTRHVVTNLCVTVGGSLGGQADEIS